MGKGKNKEEFYKGIDLIVNGNRIDLRGLIEPLNDVQLCVLANAINEEIKSRNLKIKK